MGQTISNQEIECMKTDRIISSSPHRILVGYFPKGDEENPYHCQVIRVNDEPLKTLSFYTENVNGLHYDFEDGVSLKFSKKLDDTIVYQLKTKEIDYTGTVNTSIRQNWKDIGWNSFELDRIGHFFRKGNSSV